MNSSFAYITLIIATLIIAISLLVKHPSSLPETHSIHEQSQVAQPVYPDEIKPRVPTAQVQTPGQALAPVLTQTVSPSPQIIKQLPAAPPVSAPAPQPQSSQIPVNAVKHRFSREWKGNLSGLKNARLEIITEPSSWEKTWHEFTSNKPDKILVPTIDFSKNMVVLLAAGNQQYGTQIGIIDIKQESNNLVIYYQQTPTSTEDITSRAHPYHIKVIPRRNLPVIFKKTE